jgi:hypothetical protein
MPVGGMPNQPGEVVDRHVRRTMAHEVGHALHVNHRNQSGSLSPPTGCSDSASAGSADTVMTSGWFEGLGENWGATRYNNTDRDQMRLR